MQGAELEAIWQASRQFAEQQVAPMVGTEGRDGDLARLPAVLEQAQAAGLMASADPDSPGYDYGIWGRAAAADGPAASLGMLERIAEACAGVAACLHYAGLGAYELAEMGHPTSSAAVALFEEGWRPTELSLDQPPKTVAAVAPTEPPELTGAKAFAAGLPAADTYVVYAAQDGAWQRLAVPADAPGLTVSDAGWRVGLRAVRVVSLTFDGVPIAAERGPQSARPADLVARLLLGLCAIAVGNGRAAVRAGFGYARERRQGGRLILSHPAVQILLGDASSRVTASAAHLDAVARAPGEGVVSLRRAAAAKLRITAACAQAVTDALQVFGGYGYMEDYRLEKRLRDAQALKVMGMRPDDLRMLCAVSAWGGAP